MKIFQLEIGNYNFDNFFTEIRDFVLEKGSINKKGRLIFTPNPEICLSSLHDKEFLSVLREADYLTSDGIGLYIGYQMQQDSWYIAIMKFPYYVFNIIFRKKFLYSRFGERICGSDLTLRLINFSRQNNIKVAVIDPYFPDDIHKVHSQETFVSTICERFPGLELDFYIFDPSKKDEMFKNLRNSESKIVFCTLGMKHQEILARDIIDRCENVKLALGVGSAFDYFTGFQARAPKYMRDAGLEWLYRIFTSPNKIQRIRRIFRALIIFPFTLILYKKHEKNV